MAGTIGMRRHGDDTAGTQDRALVDMVYNGLVRYTPGDATGFEPDLAVALPQIVVHLPGSMWLQPPYRFLVWLTVYSVTTLSYSLYLKRELLLDVFVLSDGRTVADLPHAQVTAPAIMAAMAHQDLEATGEVSRG